MKTLILIFSISLLISCTDNSQKTTQSTTSKPVETVEVAFEVTNTNMISENQALFNQFFYQDQNLVKVQQPEFLSQPSGDSNIYLLNGIYWDSNKNIYFQMAFSSTNLNDSKDKIEQTIATYPSNFQTFSSLDTNTIIINTNLSLYSLMSSQVLIDLPDNTSMNRFYILYYDTLKENYIEAQVCNVFNQGYGGYTNGEYFDYTNPDYLPIYPSLISTNQFGDIISNRTIYTNRQGEIFYHSSLDPGIGNLNIRNFK